MPTNTTSSSTTQDKDENDDAPLALSELRDRMTAATFRWLLEAEQKEAASQKDENVEEEEASAAISFFDTTGNNDGDEGEDQTEEKWLRVREWCSSAKNLDGIGGYISDSDDQDTDGAKKEQLNDDTSAVRIQYVLSSASGGHGETLWAASRRVANVFAEPNQCRELLAPHFVNRSDRSDPTIHDRDSSQQQQKHPLLGLNFVELGAGGGVPSWTAQHCGARVVSTDQAICDRIRCMAESAERNRRNILRRQQDQQQTATNEMPLSDAAVQYAQMARVCPYDWGTPVDEVLVALKSQMDGDEEQAAENGKCLFDVVVAADCIYMPEFHSSLLDSISYLLAPQHGVALLPFALHGNTNDDKVWGIMDLAKQKGFHVEVLESQQLTPQAYGMDSKRALVHLLRLTIQNDV